MPPDDLSGDGKPKSHRPPSYRPPATAPIAPPRIAPPGTVTGAAGPPTAPMIAPAPAPHGAPSPIPLPSAAPSVPAFGIPKACPPFGQCLSINFNCSSNECSAPISGGNATWPISSSTFCRSAHACRPCWTGEPASNSRMPVSPPFQFAILRARIGNCSTNCFIPISAPKLPPRCPRASVSFLNSFGPIFSRAALIMFESFRTLCIQSILPPGPATSHVGCMCESSSPNCRSARLCAPLSFNSEMPCAGMICWKNERIQVPDFVFVIPAVCAMAVRNITACGSIFMPP